MARTSLIPGFRFHPTDVELVMFYLKRKLLGKKITVNAVAEVNIYDFGPWDLPDKSALKNGDLEWYFFCPKAKKYSSGDRSNRATHAGFWKATGKDKIVKYNGRNVASIKTLVFHIGHKGKGERTDWVMHEYKMEDDQLAIAGIIQDTYVLCKVFKKSGLGPKNGAQYGAQFNEEEWDDLAGCGDFQMAVDSVSITVSANTRTENCSASGVSSANNMSGNCFVNGAPSANNMTENGSVSGVVSANACSDTLSLVAPQNTHGMLVSEPGSSGGQMCVTETHSDMLAFDDFIFFEDLDLLMASEDDTAAANVKKVNTVPNEDIYEDLENLTDLNEFACKTDGDAYTLDRLMSLDELEAFYVE